MNIGDDMAQPIFKTHFNGQINETLAPPEDIGDELLTHILYFESSFPFVFN